MVAAESFAQRSVFVLRSNRRDAANRTFFNEDVRRLENQAGDAARIFRSIEQRDRCAVAVADQHRRLDP
jgi:hypothetical protein